MSTAHRRARVVDAMRAAEIDVLLLGREANARYVSGAERLWLAGTRPFAPGCVLPATTGDVHLLSITDDGLPPDLGVERLYPISWNPAEMLRALTAIPGVADARRVGTDGMTPAFERLLGSALPGVELVDAESILRVRRRTKDPDEIAAIEAAVDAAEGALRSVVDALAPGVREVDLLGCFEEAMTRAGLTAPALEGSFCVAEAGAPPRTFATERAVRAGDRVHVRAGVILAGYEGLVTRTLVCGGAPVRAPLLASVVERCTPGTSVAELRRPDVRVDGTGLGHEELADDDVLAPGTAVAVEVFDHGVLDGAVVFC